MSQFSLPSPPERSASVAWASARQIGVARGRILEVGERHRLCRLDFLGRAVADEHGLAAPFDGQRHAGLHRRDVDLDRRQRQRRGVGAHLVDERPGKGGRADDTGHACGDIKEIAASGLDRVVCAHGTEILLLVTAGCGNPAFAEPELAAARQRRTAGPPVICQSFYACTRRLSRRHRGVRADCRGRADGDPDATVKC